MVPGLQSDAHFGRQRFPLVSLLRIVLTTRVYSEMVRVPGTVAGTGGRGGTISEDRTSEDSAAVVCEERTTGGAVLHRGIGRAGYISENGRGKGGQLFVQVLPEDRRTAA
jgi:hypothetical protein